jgi:hypothetical protein
VADSQSYQTPDQSDLAAARRIASLARHVQALRRLLDEAAAELEQALDAIAPRKGGNEDV